MPVLPPSLTSKLNTHATSLHTNTVWCVLCSIVEGWSQNLAGPGQGSVFTGKKVVLPWGCVRLLVSLMTVEAMLGPGLCLA